MATAQNAQVVTSADILSNLKKKGKIKVDQKTAREVLRKMTDEQFAELGGIVADELARRAAAHVEHAADQAVNNLWENLKNRLKASI